MSDCLAKHAQKILVVGGGVGGLATAIRMAERGVAVDLVDIASNWGPVAAGLTLSPLDARALCDLGFAAQLMSEGHMHDTLTLFDPAGNRITEIASPRLYAPEVPAEGGIMRPVLHRLMATRMAELGGQIRTGITVQALAQDEAGVEVTFTDGSAARYDLVIGADGRFSRLRALVMPDAPRPSYTGQVCWRAQFERPADWDGARAFIGPIKVDFTPCGPDEMHMHLIENAKEKPRHAKADLVGHLRRLLAPFSGPLAGIRDGMDAETEIIVWPLEALLVDDDWHVGRVVLIGDAVHATTPHLASGAGLAVEDAIVLAEALDATPDYTEAMAAFMARRLPRVRQVVGDSLKLGEMEQAHAPAEEVAGLMFEALQACVEPY